MKKILGYTLLGIIGLGTVVAIKDAVWQYKLDRMVQKTMSNIQIPNFTIEFNKNFAEVISQDEEKG